MMRILKKSSREHWEVADAVQDFVWVQGITQDNAGEQYFTNKGILILLNKGSFCNEDKAQ